jgi:hypothetical protein
MRVCCIESLRCNKARQRRSRSRGLSRPQRFDAAWPRPQTPPDFLALCISSIEQFFGSLPKETAGTAAWFASGKGTKARAVISRKLMIAQGMRMKEVSREIRYCLRDLDGE